MSRPSAACSLDILCSLMFSTQITDIWKTTELPEPSRSVRAVSTNVRDRKSVWMFVVECLLHSIFCTLPAVMNSMRNNATTSLCCVCNSADTVHLSFSLFFNQILCKMSQHKCRAPTILNDKWTNAVFQTSFDLNVYICKQHICYCITIASHCYQQMQYILHSMQYTYSALIIYMYIYAFWQS